MVDKHLILFLDIDGVLNIMGDTYNSYIHSNTSLNNIGTIEYHLVKRLEFIISRLSRSSSVKIVISSSWGLEDVIDTLKYYKFKYMECIYGSTPRKKLYRGEQILDWLNTTTLVIKDYIVIEDEPSDVCGEKCYVIPKDKVLEVNMRQGLSEKNAMDIVRRLNKLSYYDTLVYDDTVVIDKFQIYYDLGFEPTVNKPLNNSWTGFIPKLETLTLHMVRD